MACFYLHDVERTIRRSSEWLMWFLNEFDRWMDDDELRPDTLFDVDMANMAHNDFSGFQTPTKHNSRRNFFFSPFSLFVSSNWKQFVTPNRQIQHFSLSSKCHKRSQMIHLQQRCPKLDEKLIIRILSASPEKEPKDCLLCELVCVRE